MKYLWLIPLLFLMGCATEELNSHDMLIQRSESYYENFPDMKEKEKAEALYAQLRDEGRTVFLKTFRVEYEMVLDGKGKRIFPLPKIEKGKE